MSITTQDLDAMNEEEFDALVENMDQLDELSKTTLGSYIKKAAGDAKYLGYQAGHSDGAEHTMHPRGRREPGGHTLLAFPGRSDDDKAHSRLRGIKKAVNKLTKESLDEMSQEEFDAIDEEQLDELSKTTLGNYIKKASNDISNKSMDYATKRAGSDEVDRFTNRHMGSGKDDDYKHRDTIKKAIGVDGAEADRAKGAKRMFGTIKAVDRLTKEAVEPVDEAQEKHLVNVTMSDPNHTMVSKRKETMQKRASVTAKTPDHAINAAVSHYQKQGYKVHDHQYVGMKESVLELINAIDTGSTLNITESFNEIMASKLVEAIEHKRVEIAGNLFIEATDTETNADEAK